MINKVFKKISILFILFFGVSCAKNTNQQGIVWDENDTILVQWLNNDGSILQIERIHKNEDYSSLPYIGETPTKERTPQYSYFFDEWDKPIIDSNGNVTYKPLFYSEINKYTVKWVNYDNSILELDENVLYGSMPNYDGAIPTRPKTAQHSFTFKSWTPSISMVSSDVTYQATYTSSINTYIITLDAAGGNLPDSGTSYAIYIKYGGYYSLPSPNRLGYTFEGWYYGDQKINSVGNYFYGSDCTFVAHWEPINYVITYNLDGGTNNSSNPDTYTIESNRITLATPTKKGYTHVGWFDKDGNKITYIESGTTGNIVLTAVWTETIYSITYNYLYDGTNSSLNPPSYTINTETITLSDPTRPGYQFVGWYSNSSLNNSYKITEIAKGSTGNKSIYAKWSAINYSITYVLNGGTNHKSNPNSYTIATNTITLYNATRTGYTFAGWLDESSNQITTIPKGSMGDKTLTATWEAVKNNLLVTSQDETKGTVSVVQGSGFTGETVQILATPNSGYVFNGWYKGELQFATDADYSFEMPPQDCSIEAHFCTIEEKETWKKEHGITPVISDNTISYGLYPQTHVNDSALLSELNSFSSLINTTDGLNRLENGLICYKGEYYSRNSGKYFGGGYFDDGYYSRYFDDGSQIKEGTSYWFKCEPIIWKILSSSNGNYYLLSDKLLDVYEFYEDDISDEPINRTIDGKTIYPNNYQYSSIREWLNNDFYSKAFCLDDSLVQITNVDNSASTTHSNASSYICNDTFDKVFLPSYKDYLNSTYGFSTSTSNISSRFSLTTDWTRCSGKYSHDSSSSSSYYKCGYYWTRSPSSTRLKNYIVSLGSVTAYECYDYVICVRPAITFANSD